VHNQQWLRRPLSTAAEADALDLQQQAGNQAVGALLQGTPPDSELPDQAQDVLRAPGQPLDPATRAEMESRFGHNFGDVVIHTNPQAQESARAVGATAYTVGEDIVFGRDRYLPDTAPGKYLL